ncbi:hypothetical protein D0B54_16155 [Solimonas sp. K1W22B-7]|nr:hypothetical protein D0B54_16155 [Solimonas sp. K1W22B-7]
MCIRGPATLIALPSLLGGGPGAALVVMASSMAQAGEETIAPGPANAMAVVVTEIVLAQGNVPRRAVYKMYISGLGTPPCAKTIPPRRGAPQGHHGDGHGVSRP